MKGVLIKEYRSLAEGARINGFKIKIGERKTCHGFIWLYKKYDPIPSEILVKLLPKGGFEKAVHQYELNGKYIRSFKSISKASSSMSVHLKPIHKGIHKGKCSGGFIWLHEKFEIIPQAILQKILPNNGLGREIHQYGFDGRYIQSFKSLAKAEFHLKKNIHSPNLKKTSCGFIWLFEKHEELSRDLLKEILPNNGLGREVHQYRLDGKYIQSFKSIYSAELHLKKNIDSPNIKKTSCGFIWLFEKYQVLSPDLLREILPNNGMGKEVHQYGLDGKYIQSFKSLNNARLHFRKYISSPNLRKVSCGFIWQFIKQKVIPNETLSEILGIRRNAE